MQLGFNAQQQRDHHRASRADLQLPGARRRAQPKGDDRRHWRGDAKVARLLDALAIPDAEEPSDRQQASRKQDLGVSAGQVRDQTARQRNQAEGANTGDPAALRRGAVLPAALQPDQQTAPKRDREAEQQIEAAKVVG